jgi:hypothetical protein
MALVDDLEFEGQNQRSIADECLSLVAGLGLTASDRRSNENTPMPLIPPAKHSGLIAVTLCQNNFGHPTLADFERDTRHVIEGVRNLSFQDSWGGPLPKVILEGKAPARRLACWVARLEHPESANALAKRLKEGWIGPNQGAVTRRMDVGNGHAPRENFAQVLGVRSAHIYASAFEELKRRESDEADGNTHGQAEAIVNYLWRILTTPNA